MSPSIIFRNPSFYRLGSNVSVHAEARFGADSMERLVRRFIVLKIESAIKADTRI